MDVITSTKNPAVRKVSSLLASSRERRREGLFVVEGPRMAGEIPIGFLRGLYMTEDFAAGAGGRDLLQKAGSADIVSGENGTAEESSEAGRAADVPVTLVSDDVMRHMSGTEHPQGVLALVDTDAVRKEPVSGYPAIFLEDIQDPGNLGTIIRTSEAAGISAVYMSSGCADILSPKVVRSTMGCLFRVPLIRLDGEDFYDEIKRQQAAGHRFIAAALGGTRAYDEIFYDEKTAFLIGNEGNGLTARAIASADEKTIIPMEGQVESLNAAVAASILMFEAARQRRLCYNV